MKILAEGKTDQHDEIYLCTNFCENPLSDVGVMAPEMSIFANFHIWSLFLRERKEITNHYKNKSFSACNLSLFKICFNQI